VVGNTIVVKTVLVERSIPMSFGPSKNDSAILPLEVSARPELST